MPLRGRLREPGHVGLDQGEAATRSTGEEQATDSAACRRDLLQTSHGLAARHRTQPTAPDIEQTRPAYMDRGALTGHPALIYGSNVRLLGLALQWPYSTRDTMGKCRAVHDSQRGHAAAKHQVTRQESLPKPNHRHPDKEEVGGSSPPRPTQVRAYIGRLHPGALPSRR